MLHCGICGKFLSPTDAARCGGCALKYHRACVGISATAQINKDWMCTGCKKSVRRGNNSQTLVKGISGVMDVDAPLPSVSPQKIDVEHQRSDAGTSQRAHSVNATESDMSVMKEFLQEFKECIMKEMREFRMEMAQLRESFTTVTGRIDGMEQRLVALEQGREDGDVGRVRELESTIAKLKLELDDRDREALLSDLEIGQLPEEKGENVFHSIIVLAGRLGVSLEERDVVFAERVGVPPAEGGRQPRRVVVRLSRRQLRDELLLAARVRRAGLNSEKGPRVFINERLTRSSRQLFHRVREECRRLQWRYAWTKRGRIFARQGDGKPVFQFRSEEDLNRAFSPQLPVS
ncbi:unnamed protein product [Diatraea saccharalis]|uniref:PHD-type domain-containing protein n=1 Tax=Diatraea saccharalis TaxID=40085 RepID=A0A9N9QUU4_9NEOP|nr:unnamed protein product [Diatraea saccharalis]